MITKIMGVLLFFTGLGGILLGTAGMLGSFPALNGPEQVFLMIGGAILCVLGYIMARGRAGQVIDEEEEDKTES